MIEITRVQRLNIVPCYACKAWDENKELCTLYQELVDGKDNCYRLIKWDEVDPGNVPTDARPYVVDYFYRMVEELKRSKLTYGKEKEI